MISEDSLFNQKVLKLKSNLKTNKFVDLFYKIRDDITVYMNYNDFSLFDVPPPPELFIENNLLEDVTSPVEENKPFMFNLVKILATSLFNCGNFEVSSRGPCVFLNLILNKSFFNLSSLLTNSSLLNL